MNGEALHFGIYVLEDFGWLILPCLAARLTLSLFRRVARI